MRDRSAVGLSVAAGLLAFATLAWPYTQQPVSAVNLYYATGLFSAFTVALIVAATLAAVGAVRAGVLSPALGHGVALGLGLAGLVVATTWAITVREDVFLARGWAMPAQPFVLVVLLVALVLGLGYQTVDHGYLPTRS
ncbi:DUF7548 family protein [Haloarcula onubensis]|uniref:Uncharacterized protein n=1 Tax=Haloarcula onubensis TaxID=2950539 RepID=A0ABU2FKP4_9EURY|nr:hypothetical protein [Halomicroarcula sp. S3CR25-11]MDS0281323.1 hypothetical protein [Halomicroarcula sp. S3CR25-11]